MQWKVYSDTQEVLQYSDWKLRFIVRPFSNYEILGKMP